MRLLALALLAFLLTPDASAQTAGRLQAVNSFAVETGRVTTMGISGRSAQAVQTLMPGEDAVLVSLNVGSKNGRMCFVQAEFWRKPTAAGARTTVRRRFDQCRPQIGRRPTFPGPVRHMSLGPDSEEFTDTTFRVATGLQACSVDGAPRLSNRMVLLLPSESDTRGRLTPLTAQRNAEEAVRSTSCRMNALQARTCPAGQAVVGVDVHYRPSPIRDATVMGLAPKCAPLVVSHGSVLRGQPRR